MRARVQTRGSGASAALADQEDYARNLLRTKDLATVTEVLSSQTGVSPVEVQAWLEKLGRHHAQ